MPRIKVARKSTAVDMTAMCDVAFLLLTFFILTATAKQADPLEIKIPTSSYTVKVPDKDLGILTVVKGKVFYEMLGQDIKKRTLQLMGKQYGITFTPEEETRFGVLASFGVPIQNLKQYIMMNAEERTKSGLETTGIPIDTTANSQLKQWIYNSQYAVKELHNEIMRVSIKGDAEEEYPVYKKIVDILQKQEINKFGLVTTPEGTVK